MCRHSAATFLNQQTGNLKFAQKFLGHVDITTTANIYTNTSGESDPIRADAMLTVMMGKTDPKDEQRQQQDADQRKSQTS